MGLRSHFDSLLLYDPHRSPNTANVWIAHPTPTEESALGKLAVVMLIDSPDRLNHEIISLIQEELKQQYYQQLDAKPDKAFEAALQRTNQRLHQLISDGVAGWVDRAHCLAAVLWREELHLSTVGPMHAYLIRRDRLHDILGPAETRRPNPLRLFSQVISGQLQAGDRLLFCAPSLLDYFSVEKLRRTMIDFDPTASVRQWETTLLGMEQRSSFAALVVQTASAETAPQLSGRPVPQTKRFRNAPQASMEELIAQEQVTQRLLSPSIWPAIRDIANQLSQAAQQLVRRFILRKPPRRAVPRLGGAILPPARQPFSRPPVRAAFEPWRQGFERVWRQALAAFRPTWRFRRPTGASEPALPAGPRLRPRWSISGVIRWWQQLSRRRQSLFGLGVLIIFVLAVSILRNSSPTASPAAASTLTQMNDRVAKAQAALLYGGEETARQNLIEAQKLFSRLPSRKARDRQVKDQAGRQLDALVAALSRLTLVIAPTLVIDVSTVNAQLRPQQLYAAGTSLVAFDPRQAKAVIINSDGSVDETLTNTLDTGQLTTGAVTSSTTLLFGTDRQGFVELDLKKKTWKPLDAAYPQDGPRIQSIASYLSRVYVLETNHSDIVRFNKGTNSLGTGSSWLKESAAVSRGRTLVVDGSIFILQPDGQVEEFQAGRRVNFRLSSVTPALTDATRLWTDAASKHLYLLDPANRRFLVFDKTGKLLDQYQSSVWSRLLDVTANEKTKTAYVLNGTSMYSVSLKQ